MKTEQPDKGLRVVAVAAMSLDGRITHHDRPGNAFTSAADKRHFSECLTAFDCSIIGRNTFEASKGFILDNLAPSRLRVVITQAPEAFARYAIPGQLEFTADSPRGIVTDLFQRGYRQCVHLGGGEAYSAFQSAGVVDEWWVTIEPRIFGSGRSLCSGQLDTNLELISAERLYGSDSLLLKYRVVSR